MTTFSRTSLLSVLLTGAVSVSAQTAAPAAKAPVHHTATTAAATHRPATTAVSACATDIPTLSSKIPALPAGLSCPKPLYTMTRKSEVTTEYMSPLISAHTRESLTFAPTTFSLDYVDTVIGKGDLLQPEKFISVHYTGYLPDGTKFDSSVDRGEPISFPYGQHRVIPGWDTGFEGMHIGGKRRLFIPYQLAYGEAGHPPAIPAKSWLVFDVEFVGQSDTAPAPKTPPAAQARPATPPPSAAPKAATPPAQPAAAGSTTAPKQ